MRRSPFERQTSYKGKRSCVLIWGRCPAPNEHARLFKQAQPNTPLTHRGYTVVDINEQAHVGPSSESIVAATPKSISFVTIRQAIELALRLGDPSAAENGARYLLRMFPEAVAPMILLGQALLDLGDAPAAIAHFRLALSHNPCDAAAWIGLAGALSLDGQTG